MTSKTQIEECRRLMSTFEEATSMAALESPRDLGDAAWTLCFAASSWLAMLGRAFRSSPGPDDDVWVQLNDRANEVDDGLEEFAAFARFMCALSVARSTLDGVKLPRVECPECGRPIAAGPVAGHLGKGRVWRHDPPLAARTPGGPPASCDGSLRIVDLPAHGAQLKLDVDQATAAEADAGS